jgi:hypothetical protein
MVPLSAGKGIAILAEVQAMSERSRARFCSRLPSEVIIFLNLKHLILLFYFYYKPRLFKKRRLILPIAIG